MTGGRVIVLDQLVETLPQYERVEGLRIFSHMTRIKRWRKSTSQLSSLDKPYKDAFDYVHGQISKFVELTGSEFGQRILDNWTELRRKIVEGTKDVEDRMEVNDFAFKQTTVDIENIVVPGKAKELDEPLGTSCAWFVKYQRQKKLY
ncbi:unnamed protein product, partial [Mesorhabditis spiculigera]